jgi:hypothetical protein
MIVFTVVCKSPPSLCLVLTTKNAGRAGGKSIPPSRGNETHTVITVVEKLRRDNRKLRVSVRFKSTKPNGKAAVPDKCQV